MVKQNDVIAVKFSHDKRGLAGRSQWVHKIIFVAHGHERGVCTRHPQECRVVKDTKPDDDSKGAVIVRLVHRACPACAKSGELAKEWPAGWTVGPAGTMLSPDGIDQKYWPDASEMTRKDVVSAWEARRRLAVASDLLTDEFVSKALALPPVEGAPHVPEAKPRPAAPPAWMPVDMEVPSGEGVGQRSSSMYADDRWRSGVFIDAAGRLGTLAQCAGVEYESDDGMGTRIGGGGTYLVPFQDQSGAASPAAQAALTSLRAAIAAAPGQEKAWVDEEVARRQAVRAWWAWWLALPPDQKVRLIATADDGGLCAVARDKEGRWRANTVLRGPAWEGHYANPAFPAGEPASWVGPDAPLRWYGAEGRYMIDGLRIAQVMSAVYLEDGGTRIDRDHYLHVWTRGQP